MSMERNQEYIDHKLREFKKIADANYEVKKFSQGLVGVYDIDIAQSKSRPVLFVQGWGVYKPRYRKMKTISDGSNRVIAVHPLPLGAKLASTPEVGFENKRKASLYLQTLEEKKIHKVDAIAVSGGAGSLLTAAKMEPRIFGNIVLVTPVGLNGPVNEWDLTWRFVRKEKSKSVGYRDRKIDLTPLQASVEFVMNIASPKRVASEVVDMSQSDTYELARDAVSNGINVSVICAEKDNLFPLIEIYRHFDGRKDENGTTCSSPFFEMQVVDGYHDETSPDPLRVKKAVSLLERMSS